MTCATYAADSENAERYVLGQMGEAEQASFEEHFFGCDACFASVQTLQQMQTALRTETVGAEQAAPPVAAPLVAAQPVLAQPAAAQPAAGPAPPVLAFPRRGIAGVDAKWWGLAIAATLLLTAVWWPRRGVDPTTAPETSVARNTDPAVPRSNPPSGSPRSNPPSGAQSSGVKPSDGQPGSKVPGGSGNEPGAGGQVKPPSSSPSSTPAPREPVRPVRGLEALAVVTPPPYVPLQTRGAANNQAQSFAAAMTRYSAKDFAGAAEQLQPLAEANPGAAHVQFFLGIAQLMSGKPAAAIESLDRAVASGTAPFADEAHFYLAKAAMQTRDLARAERELQIAVEREAGPAGEAAELLRDLKKIPRP
jgi:hypothetical protein